MDKTVIYSVFTVPDSIRERYLDPKEWSKVRRKVWMVLKSKFGGSYGFEASHPIGENQSKFHPHLNFIWIQKNGYSPFIDVEMLRQEWSTILKVDEADVYTQYTSSPARIMHWCKYVTRVFTGYSEWTGRTRWYGSYPKSNQIEPSVCPDCKCRIKVIGRIDADVVRDYYKYGYLMGIDPPWLDDSKITYRKD